MLLFRVTKMSSQMCVCCNLTSYTSAIICTKSLRVAEIFHVVESGVYTKTGFDSWINGVRVNTLHLFMRIRVRRRVFTLTPIEGAFSQACPRVHDYVVKQLSVRGGCLGS